MKPKKIWIALVVTISACIIGVVFLLAKGGFTTGANTSPVPPTMPNTVDTPSSSLPQEVKKWNREERLKECPSPIYEPLMPKDEAIATYFSVWKRTFLLLNHNMSDEYFNKHVIVGDMKNVYGRGSDAILNNPDSDPCYLRMNAEYLQVNYKVKIDWAEWNNTELLMMKDVGEKNYKSETAILSNASNYVVGSHKFIPVEKLNLSRDEAIKKIKKMQIGLTFDETHFGTAPYNHASKDPEIQGHIFLINSSYGDRCFEVYLNLTGDKNSVEEFSCVIE